MHNDYVFSIDMNLTVSVSLSLIKLLLGVCRTELGRYIFEPSALPIPEPILAAINFVGKPLFSKYDNTSMSVMSVSAKSVILHQSIFDYFPF